jgi:hypothetical protein
MCQPPFCSRALITWPVNLFNRGHENRKRHVLTPYFFYFARILKLWLPYIYRPLLYTVHQQELLRLPAPPPKPLSTERDTSVRICYTSLSLSLSNFANVHICSNIIFTLHFQKKMAPHAGFFLTGPQTSLTYTIPYRLERAELHSSRCFILLSGVRANLLQKRCFGYYIIAVYVVP